MEKKITLQVEKRFTSSSSSSFVPKIKKPFLHLKYPHQNQQWLPPEITTSKFLTISTNPSLIRPNIHLNCRRWDSNAENFRTRDFNSSSTSQDFDEDDDDEEEESNEEWSEFLEEFIGQAWILKVLRSYGWALPAIILSLLLTTGPKALLLTLAIPLGQTALSLAFQKVTGRIQSKPKRSRGNARKKTRGTPPKYVDLNKEKGERGRSGKGSPVFQTWASGKGVNDKSKEESSSFGGWEDLDMGRNTQFEKGSDQTAEKKRRILRSKMSKREGRSDSPLLLRLLISVFPFLSSWTRML